MSHSFPFSKYSGAGNTFFFIDNRKKIVPLSDKRWITSLCRNDKERCADGVILLELSEKADFRMRIFNSDASEAEMCGNGLRSLIKFLQELEILQPEYHIETGIGMNRKFHTARIVGDQVIASMNNPERCTWQISLALPDFGDSRPIHFLNTGVPHAVCFLDSISELDLFPIAQVGSSLRHHIYFAPHGTNVNFAVIQEKNNIVLRTFERGVEDETPACGTGAVATALAAAHLHGFSSPILVKVHSGDELRVFFKKNLDHFIDVYLEGPAKKISEGFFQIDSKV